MTLLQTGPEQVIGYCVHCRSRRPMINAIQVCNRRGGRDLKGYCAMCGKAMYRLGGWDSVAAAKQGSAAEPVTMPPVEVAVEGS